MNLIKDHPLTVYHPLPRGLNAGVLTDSPIKEPTVATAIFPMEECQGIDRVLSAAADISIGRNQRIMYTQGHTDPFVSGQCVLMTHTVIMFDQLLCVQTQTDWLIWLRPL